MKNQYFSSAEDLDIQTKSQTVQNAMYEELKNGNILNTIIFLLYEPNLNFSWIEM